jgi:hypothetical protein
MTKYAEGPSLDAAKKALAEDKKVVDKSRAEYAERSKGKPTPTQEELDMTMLGAQILEHDEDGSDPDPRSSETKHAEAGRPASYQTRQETSRHSKSSE